MKSFTMTRTNHRMSFMRLAYTAGMIFLILAVLMLGLQPVTPTLAGLDRVNINTGTFVDSGQDVGGAAGNVVALGDLDGDDDLDAFVKHEVWFNDGRGSFSDSG